jgi:hypothetical protein
MGRFLSICILLTVVAIPADAYEPRAAMSGNQLLSVCESAAASDHSACTAYVAGVVDLLEQLAFRDDVKCWPAIPQQVTVQQMADIVLKYLKDHPEHRHYSGASNVRLAIEGARFLVVED